ncbi:MAG: DUF2225 domain-containing protein [Lachnospiraceae bacterium]|nr:DUF2225 domain-containing protein [Lachnospiraceae bacterium]
MNIFSGLEKFGLKSTDSVSLFDDEQKDDAKKADGKQAEEKIPAEEEFLLDKTVRCKVCDQVFKTKVVKNGRVKRLEPDKDLRPRFQYIDTLKYDITSCPSCGYTAMNRYFDQLMPAQEKLIREQIASKFQGKNEDQKSFYTYDEAIDRYKLSLMNTVVKKGKDSEKAYTCLKIAWLLRGKAETMPLGTPEEKAAREECQKEEEVFYQQAYEGFVKAVSKEMFPMCGMEQSTVDYLLAYMAYHFGKYDVASKLLASVMASPSASRRMKDMGLELKNEIIAELRK